MRITDRLQILKSNFTATLTGTFTANRLLTLPDRDGMLLTSTDIAPNKNQGGLEDHFISWNSAVGGSFQLSNLLSGTGASVGIIPGEASNPGVLRCQTGTATNGSVVLQTPTTLLFGTKAFTFKATVRIPELANTTDNFGIRIGFGDRLPTTPFSISDAVFFVTDVNNLWIAQTRNNAVTTSTTSAVGLAANAFTDLEIRVNASGTEAVFLVNGTVVATLTTNIPTGVGRDTGIMLQLFKSAGTNSRSLDIDFMSLEWA